MTDITWTSERRKLGDLREWDRNPRQLSKHDAEAIAASIGKFNLADPLVINADNQIIGGHQRKRVMLDNGYRPDDIVDVRVPSRQLTDKEAEELNIRLNRNSGDWDFDVLANEFELDELLEWGFTEYDFQVAGIDWGENEPAQDPGPQVDRAEELQQKWQVQRGQVWEIGRHRLMCGDSTNAGDVGRLMMNSVAQLMVTDPPYGVNYDTSGANPRWRSDSLPIANDDLGEDQGVFWTAALKDWPLVGDAYVCGPPGPLSAELASAVVEAGIDHHQWLIWAKDRFALGRSHYHYRHENILYGWRGKSSWNDSRTEDSVWEIKRPSASPMHPTTKPTELFVRAINNSSQRDAFICDPFLGSGTTLVACEQTNRIGYGMEIEPKYCAVTLERLTGMGLEAKLVSEKSETV